MAILYEVLPDNWSNDDSFYSSSNHLARTVDDKSLSEKIEKLRSKLVMAALGSNRLSDQYVLEISQELDKYIVEFQTRQLKKSRKK